MLLQITVCIEPLRLVLLVQVIPKSYLPTYHLDATIRETRPGCYDDAGVTQGLKVRLGHKFKAVLTAPYMRLA